MNRFATHLYAAALAVVLALGPIGAIVTVPPAQAAAPTMLALPALA